MLKAAYQRLVGSSSGTDNDERIASAAATPPTDYGSTFPQQAEEQENIIPESIRVRRSLSSSRRQQSWKLIRNSLISRNTTNESGDTTSPGADFVDIAESVFSDIRSESAASQLAISNEAEDYGLCTAYERAFPERSFALFVTLIFELPTLFMISGGSDRLCGLIGRRKYTALISLLPIISAVSGNVGLQASTLTTRAISHSQVCVDNYSVWLKKEVTAAMYLGCAMGLISSSIAFCMGGFSVPFALSIFTAQWIGIFTAGVTGTLAPLLFTFIFERDSGKWGGPLETAVQDVVGSFAMIVVTYWIMSLFGPYDIELDDMC
eukprot:scaffold6413_cov149-Skeletonema_dohrnii-CCMP3373.AAC.3